MTKRRVVFFLLAIVFMLGLPLVSASGVNDPVDANEEEVVEEVIDEVVEAPKETVLMPYPDYVAVDEAPIIAFVMPYPGVKVEEEEVVEPEEEVATPSDIVEEVVEASDVVEAAPAAPSDPVMPYPNN